MMAKQVVLIIDDEPRIQRFIRDLLPFASIGHNRRADRLDSGQG
ncbi:MAG TPA: hypothetical protein VGK74_10855 [Symbiobacteriaceae bacterium]|jgi:hypothetical protein